MTVVELCCPVAHEFAPDAAKIAIPAAGATEFYVTGPVPILSMTAITDHTTG
jgi:hypothetical protein